MKRLFVILAVIAGIAPALKAQTYETVDSLVYTPVSGIDESLVGKNIFSEVNVLQSQDISRAMTQKIERNKSKKISGYRVRIFFDNKQDSRGASEAAMNRFLASYPGHGAYRSFSSPFFKVSVGDFRTKSEAMKMLDILRPDFPSALVVKENINYPIIDKEHSYTVDTVTVRRRTTQQQ